MTGRQEHNEILDNKTKAMLVGQPEILEEYFYSFTDKTSFTKKEYTRIVIEFIRYLGKNGFDVYDRECFASVKKSDIDKYMNTDAKYRVVGGVKIENGESNRATKFYAISNFFDFLESGEYIKVNPCSKVKPPRVNIDKDIVAMTPDEIEMLKTNIINGVGSQRSIAEHEKWINRDLAIVTLGCSTGLRITSISEINISDINFDKNTVVVREKGNKERTIYFGDNTARTIKNWIKDRNRMFPYIKTDALFVSRKEQRMAARTMYDTIIKFSAGIGKHITPHKMRSSCATNLYEKTGDIYLVAKVLGHKNIANTRKYARISEEKRRTAVDILDNL